MIAIALLLLAVVDTYFLSTLMIWLGHYWPHWSKGAIREFHLGGHHTHYPNSKNTRSAVFKYGQGRHDSLVPQMPWLIALAVAFLFLLPVPWALALSIENFALAAFFSYVHSQFHLTKTWLDRFQWFRYARNAHDVHHDHDVNFMVWDHFWDRIFRTYKTPASATIIHAG